MTYQAENDRLRRCITMAMGCISPSSQNVDERLAWYRLLAGLEGREARLPGEVPSNEGAGTLSRDNLTKTINQEK